MKYKELIQFEPINEVVKFERLGSDDYRKSLVRNFVFSETYEKTIIPQLCRNLDYTASHETFGIQIVGNYGTGKSHLMSLFSLVAEDEAYLPLVQNESARKVFHNIAGKYKVIRFELGSDDELWRLVGFQIDRQLKEWGVEYSILNDTAPDMYKDKLNRMMAHFEQTFPDKGLMIVIDEMLSYLKGRSGSDKLNRDLSVLQALGQMSDHSRFRMVFGVQELIYNSPEFGFASDMLNKVNDRFRQIEITKQDVQYVVQQRLLRKTDEQKGIIRRHLEHFTEFFPDMHANMDEYVSLFPVNPSFFENFQQIRIGKSQRELLKTLTRKFEDILDDDVPEKAPGLICYDSYWEDLQSSEMQTYPDIRRVTEIMNTVHQKINENFTGVRAKKAKLAHRIADACAVKILQDSLEKTNGVNAEILADDLCYLDASCFDREMLIDVINTTASQIVSATVGQYFEKNNANQEYHLRVEGGVNYEQKIKDFAATMSLDNKDSHFFNFLCEYLPIEVEQYRREFKIFSHRIEWRSHKTMLDGYIFMGNPSERSTTQPQQNFYIYFMPVFNKANTKHGNEPDSVFVHFDKVSNEMKELLELYAAAESLFKSVDSSQKLFYQQFKKKYEDKLKPIFKHDFENLTEVVYQGEVQSVSLRGVDGSSKEQVISDVASNLLEDYFCSKMPDYPKFTLLRAPLTPNNRPNMLKSARQKIVNPSQANRDGEAILAGLGLWMDGTLTVDGSIYAQSVMQKLEDKGEGQVLNRDELLHRFYAAWDNDWRSNDYGIEADLEFLVLATLVALGEIEINFPGKSINAANLKDIVELPADNFYSFSHVRRPKGMNLALVKKIFLNIVHRDLTPQLGNPETYVLLATQAQKIAASAVKLSHDIANGISLSDIEVMNGTEAMQLRNRLKALAGFCDKLQTFNSKAKLANLPAEWNDKSLKPVFDTISEIERTRRTLLFVTEFRQRFDYLSQAIDMMTDDKMVHEVKTVMAKISDIVPQMNNEQKVNAYKSELDDLISRYADWYMAEYKRMHITGIQDTEKNRILQSNANKACEALFRADHDKGYFSQSVPYADWTRRMAELEMAKSSVNREAVLQTPYLGFNPKMFAGKQLPKLGEINEELNQLFGQVDEAAHALLGDEKLLANKDLLDESELGLLNRFNAHNEELSPANAARLVEIASKLHRGIHRINVTANDLRNVLNRPMTPDDAIKALRTYLNSLKGGGDGNDVRIIFQ